MIGQNTDQKNCLLQILTCLICQNKANQAHICPNCSKFYCFTCITNWINQNQSQCPYCCKSLSEKQLVNCQKLCHDLSSALQKINHTNKKSQSQNNCSAHNLKKNYYCSTCSISLCSDCSVLLESHKGHQFVKLTEIKKQFQKNSSNLKHKLLKFKEQMTAMKNTIEKKQAASSSTFVNNPNIQAKIKTIQSKFKQFKDKISKKLVAQNNNIEQLLDEEQEHFKEGEKVYQKLMTQLKVCPKAKFIGVQYKLINSLISTQKDKLFQSNTKAQKAIQNLSEKSIQSQLVPQYQSKKFVLDNYTQLKLDRNVVYSQYFFVNGLQWRLKIYPGGNDQSEEEINYPQKLNSDMKPRYEFLSVFIQLKEGFQQLGRYRHKIQIVNQVHQQRGIIREFQSYFQIGSCWGYNQFAKISTLYDENYVDAQTDQIQIVLYIASSTYYHANLDLQKLLTMKKHKIQQNQKRIQLLMKAKSQFGLVRDKNDCKGQKQPEKGQKSVNIDNGSSSLNIAKKRQTSTICYQQESKLERPQIICQL